LVEENSCGDGDIERFDVRRNGNGDAPIGACSRLTRETRTLVADEEGDRAPVRRSIDGLA
jgi:hypothetical protein